MATTSESIAAVVVVDGITDADGASVRETSSTEEQPPAYDTALPLVLAPLPTGTYEICLRKTDTVFEIGADLVPTAGRIFQVQMLWAAGLLADWNNANPYQTVKPGDFIVNVNGVSGSCNDLQKRLAEDDTLTMHLTRFAQPQDGAPIAVPAIITYTYLDYESARFVEDSEAASEDSLASTTDEIITTPFIAKSSVARKKRSLVCCEV